MVASSVVMVSPRNWSLATLSWVSSGTSDRDRGSSHSGAVAIRQLSIHGNVGTNFCLWRLDVLLDVSQLGLGKMLESGGPLQRKLNFRLRTQSTQIQTCCNHPSKIDLIYQKCCQLHLQSPNPYNFHLHSKFTKLNKFEPQKIAHQLILIFKIQQ